MEKRNSPAVCGMASNWTNRKVATADLCKAFVTLAARNDVAFLRLPAKFKRFNRNRVHLPSPLSVVVPASIFRPNRPMGVTGGLPPFVGACLPSTELLTGHSTRPPLVRCVTKHLPSASFYLLQLKMRTDYATFRAESMINPNGRVSLFWK